MGNKVLSRLIPVAPAGVIAMLLSLSAPAGAATAPSPGAAEEAEACLACHSDETLSMKMESGETAPLTMKPEVLAASVHKALRCTDCHAGLDEVPHAERRHKNLQQWKLSFTEVCKTCHYDNYNKTLDSVHYGLQTRGDAFAPNCVKCHGSHEIMRPAQPRSRISQTCATCHQGISAKYARSVHGKALIEDGNQDVPVCTDCHRSHDIAGTKDRAWLLKTPTLCGRCHADSKLMAKYGLSTAVLSTYVADFHGTTAGFGPGRKGAGDERLVALCVDCHGIHDIAKVKDPTSPVFRTNLVKTCAKCHANATDNFPAAWLSHYEPSFSRAPLVYSVRLFYWFIIPFIVGGLLLQILLHLWRVVVNR
jgi:predicted CXXCH cytochrome family protein